MACRAGVRNPVGFQRNEISEEECVNEKRMGVVAVAAALALASAGFVANAHAQDAAATPAASTQAAGTPASGAQPSKQASKKSKAKTATVTSDAAATGSMGNW